MRPRWIQSACVALLVPLPLFVEFAEAIRWVRFVLTGDEALPRLPAGESLVSFSPLSFGLIAVVALALWGIALLSARWLRSTVSSVFHRDWTAFVLLWIVLTAVSVPLTAGDAGIAGPLWMLLKIGIGVLLALLAATLLAWPFARRQRVEP
ncbi:MAG: hypothetical protein MUE46_18750 [Xanthomonadales bacterium]|jgi:hypothetical protein|nr:hypothetical protein [Xanthomonadales bacterium]